MAKKILLIDDDVKILKLVEIRLKAYGFEVVSAASGTQGLEKAKSEGPDVILLDIMMPDMDGYEVMEKLKKDEDTKAIPVIMLTAKREIDDIVKSMSGYGAVGYISKPFSAPELLKKINNALVVFGKDK
jgi:DNA-binding response OmpR family regulator